MSATTTLHTALADQRRKRAAAAARFEKALLADDHQGAIAAQYAMRHAQAIHDRLWQDLVTLRAAGAPLPSDDGPDTGEYSYTPAPLAPEAAAARWKRRRLEGALLAWQRHGDLPADLDRYARAAWYLFHHQGRAEFKDFARALYAAIDARATLPDVSLERPPLGPKRSVMDLAFEYGDAISLKPEPVRGNGSGQRHEDVAWYETTTTKGEPVRLGGFADEDATTRRALVLDAIAAAALEGDQRPQVDRLQPKRAVPVKGAPARYEHVDQLVAEALAVDDGGHLRQTVDTRLLEALRDSASIELQLEADAACGNVRAGYGLCLYDPDRDANSLMRSAFDGPDSEIDALLRDDLDEDERDELETNEQIELLATTTAHVEYETASGMQFVAEERLDPEQLIALFRGSQLNRVFVTAEERFDANGLADYIDREHRLIIERDPEGEHDAAGEDLHTLRAVGRKREEVPLGRITRLQELRMIHAWASARLSLVLDWRTHPCGQDYPTPEAWEAAWCPDSPTARGEHLALVRARVQAIAAEAERQRLLAEADRASEQAAEHVADALALDALQDDAYAASWS